MSKYREYKQYICNSLHGVMTEDHIIDLKRRIVYGVDTTEELYKMYNPHFKLSNHGEELMTFEIWLREERLKKLLD
ncbi:MAG: hypothetical protein SLAVMIC_00838 [uncultured marine phage]|uniref:Uncharacterized protein n=1 Tax=uncultured marine phage TaxID=707152 RepID=A0A8D9FQK2_9VIRU|nr:MAG: hypothetical protein SLAVMIC_00838 [uncultured marine phage]